MVEIQPSFARHRIRAAVLPSENESSIVRLLVAEPVDAKSRDIARRYRVSVTEIVLLQGDGSTQGIDVFSSEVISPASGREFLSAGDALRYGRREMRRRNNQIK